MHVVILGGGPAGAATALTLRHAPVSVTLVERARFPRPYPGATLHPGIEPLLATLGASDILSAGTYIRHSGVWSAWGEAPRFVPYGEDDQGPWRGFQAIRSDFDRRLLEHAGQAGARVLVAAATGVIQQAHGRVCGVHTSTGSLRSDYVIDCTGDAQLLARSLRIPIVRCFPPLVARFGYVRG